MHAIIYINSQGYHDLKVIDYIQYEVEKRIYLPKKLPIKEHSKYFLFFFYKMESVVFHSSMRSRSTSATFSLSIGFPKRSFFCYL